MGQNNYGRDQRDYIQFENSSNEKRGRFPGRNRFGEEQIHHDSYQDQELNPEMIDLEGNAHPLEHGGKLNRWSDDLRSESAHESHSGKGPIGYERKDERIKDEACELLTRDERLDASEITVDVQDRCLYLEGEVGSRFDKRLAEDLVENIAGLIDVQNQIKIRRSVGGPYGE